MFFHYSFRVCSILSLLLSFFNAVLLTFCSFLLFLFLLIDVGNNIGKEGGVAIAKALETNATLASLYLNGMIIIVVILLLLLDCLFHLCFSVYVIPFVCLHFLAIFFF